MVLHRQDGVSSGRSPSWPTDADFPGVEVVYRPFQLDPHAPRDRAEPVLDVYARKFGGQRTGRSR